MPHRLFPVLCAGLLLAAGSGAQATPYVPDFSSGPIVFDFEDGLQGWELWGPAQRVQTQVLGGDWAILGDGLQAEARDLGHGIFFGDFPGIRLQIDLAQVGRITIEQFFAGSPTAGTDFVVQHRGLPREGTWIGALSPLASDDPAANPGIRSLDLSETTGTPYFTLAWYCVQCPSDDPAAALGFIDNITLYPLPEPDLGRLVLGSLAVLWALARRRRAAAAVAHSPPGGRMIEPSHNR